MLKTKKAEVETMKKSLGNFDRIWFREAHDTAGGKLFNSKEIDGLELALAQALERLIAVRHPCTVESNFETTKQMLALAILEAAADGERNPRILADHALDRLHDD